MVNQLSTLLLRLWQLPVLRLLIVLFMTGVAAPLAAAPGRVTVDNEVLPAVLFKAPLNGFGRDCPPVSDNRMRESMVMLHLIVREGERLKLAMDKVDRMGIERAQTVLERLPTNAAERQRAQPAFDVLSAKARVYKALLIGEIGDDGITERYRRAIDEKRPELVDVVLLRYTMHEFGTEEARALALRELELGSTYEQLVAAGRFGRFNEHEDEEWRMLERWTRIEPTVDKLAPGDIAINKNFGSSLLHVTDTKVLSRIRPHQPINGDKLHAWSTVKYIIYKERELALETRLREKAIVREDGDVVFASDTYPACLER